MVYNMVQWAVIALEGHVQETNELCNVLCTSTFSLLGVLLPATSPKHHLTYLQFFCLALLHASPKAVSSSCVQIYDLSQFLQKTSVNSSLRRIGEVCAHNECFCTSSDVRTRILSSLLILHSTAQGEMSNNCCDNDWVVVSLSSGHTSSSLANSQM